MGFFDEVIENEINKKDNNEINITKEDILTDIEKYHDLLPKDIYDAVKDNPELMAEIIMLLLKKKDGKEEKDARTLYKEQQISKSI